MKAILQTVFIMIVLLLAFWGNRAMAQVTYFNDANGNITGTATQLGFMTFYQDSSSNFVGSAINLQPMPYVPAQVVSQPMPMMPPFAPPLMPLLPMQTIFGGK
jgi:hypothetical protein